MPHSAEKTASVAAILNEALAILTPRAHEVASRETEAARQALKMAHKLLEIRAANGNVEVTIFDDAARLAGSALKAARKAYKRPHDSDDMRAAVVMINLAKAIGAYHGKRTEDGSHVLDTPLRFINEAWDEASA